MAKRPRRATQDPLMPTPRGQRMRQVRASVNAQINPMIAEMQRRYTAQAEAGARNIGGVTSQLAQELMPYQQRSADIYNRSINDLAGLNERLGGQLASNPGAQGAFLGSAGAELPALLQGRAAAEDYSAKLPGLARLQGLQQIGQLRAEKQRGFMEESGRLRAEVPGLVSNLMNQSDRAEVEKAIALRGFGLDQRKLLEEMRQFNQDQATRVAEARKNRNFEAREASKQRIAAKQAEARAEQRAQAQAQREGRKFNEALSREKGWAVDDQGRYILDEDGKRIKVRKQKPSNAKPKDAGKPKSDNPLKN